MTYVVLRHAMLYAKTVPAAALEFASRAALLAYCATTNPVGLRQQSLADQLGEQLLLLLAQRDRAGTLDYMAPNGSWAAMSITGWTSP